MSQEIKLLPCPFCGGEPILQGSIDTGRSIECLGCHCQIHGPRRIDLWNTRTAPEQLAKGSVQFGGEGYWDSKPSKAQDSEVKPTKPAYKNVKDYCMGWWDGIEAYKQQVRREVSLLELEDLISLKLSQMIVNDEPDSLGYTKAKVIAEAIHTRIYGGEK